VTFLANVYKNSFLSALPTGVVLDEKIINGLVGGQLFSSLLAVCCVTVAFCSNMLMVHDKISHAREDLLLAPIKKHTLALSYYIATTLSTLIICFVACGASFIYLAVVGWYLSFVDILLIFFDVFLLVMFGVALSSIVNYFLSSQGQISAVGSIISSCYGFICGAYMPISSFGVGLQKVISFLPGTYGTSLIKNHTMRGVFSAMEEDGIPKIVIDSLRESIDCKLYFFDNEVTTTAMYTIMVVSVVLLVGVYVLMNFIHFKKHATKQ
jgi:multidrug/hemolysin transport system permease protein